ncbi:MAG TPA: GNAT family N-acetyltransferase, partial [Pyrinomonadaceae bacterium]|nr:GNAT family N-acetyltransferase [Pyrinomonadaceae bacterium]
MMDDELELANEPQPSETDVRIVSEGLLAFNVAYIGREPQDAPVTLFLRDTEGRVVGGLMGGWRWGWLYTNKLWVQEQYRGQGAGSRLLRAVETQALAAGCTDAVLDTFSFQASPFYERHGYKIYATLEGFPPGYRLHFLHKRLAAGL